HHRGFSGTIRADERNPVAALDVQAGTIEHALLTIRFADVSKIDHRPAAFWASGKRKVHPFAFCRDLDRYNLVEHLDPALNLCRLRRLIAEAIDERFHSRHFVVLVLLALAQLLHARLTLAQVSGVVAGVVGQRSQTDFRDPGDDGVEEEAVVRYEDDGMWIFGEILLEPLPRF